MVSKNIVLVKLEGKMDRLFPPYGIMYLADSLRKAGYNPILFHKYGTGKSIQELLRLVSEKNPLFVGFSLLTGPAIAPAIKASELLKEKFPELNIIWGGVHPSLLPHQCLKEDFIDFVVVGEGEKTIVELAEALKNKKNELDAVSGLVYSSKGKLRINSCRDFLENLDEFTPAWDLLNIDRYIKDKAFTLVTSRGCPHRCGFCYNAIVNKRKWRAHTANWVLKQLKYLGKYDINHFEFRDDNFFTDRNRAFEIVDFIRQKNKSWSATLRQEFIKDKFISRISKTNCLYLEIGAETGSPLILKYITKDSTLDDLFNAVKVCKKYFIKPYISFIIGFPKETWKDVLETFDVADKIMKMNIGTEVGVKIYTPYPGTPLWQDAIEQGYAPSSSLQEWSNYNRTVSNVPWAGKKYETAVFIASLIQKKNLPKHIEFLARLRWNFRFFYFPLLLDLYKKSMEKKKRIVPASKTKYIRGRISIEAS